ncbi:hypothetical protein ABPG75_002210 [Micractinium tetrahymenae]
MAAAEAAERRLKLVRVKRKRAAEAPEDLVVEGLEAPGKRAHTTLSSAMAGLGLEGQAAVEEGAAPAPAGDDADAAAAAPAARRQRFRRLSTLSAAQLRSIDGDQLASLLAAQHEAAAARRSGIKSGGAGAAGAAAAAATAGRAAQQLQAGQAARYEQIRRRRGLPGPPAAGSSPAAAAEADPLQQLASVYDLVRHDDGEASAAAAPAGPGAAAGQRQSQQGEAQQSRQRRPSRAERAAQQYDEGTLLCNYMPMIREYLASQGRPLPAEEKAAAAAAGAAQPGSAAGSGAQPAQPSGSQGGGPANQDSDGDEYVYDIYAALSEDEAGDGREVEEQWWELHAAGAAPVVQIIDDDTWLVIEQPDAEDSDADSEDSNAEGFYAHDYPDESSSDHDSSLDGDDDGYDPEGDTFHRSRAAGRRQQQRSWEEQSYGSGASWE